MNRIGTRAAALRLTIAGACGIAMASAASATEADRDAGYRSAVERSIDSEMAWPRNTMDSRRGVTTLAVTVRPDGAVKSIDIVKSSGVAAFDKQAVRTAQRITYPAAPDTRTLAMVLGFNQQVLPAHRTAGRVMVAAWLNERKTRLAADSAAQQPDI